MNPKVFCLLLAATLAVPSASVAMEASTDTNDRASLATAMRALADERAKQLADLAILQAKLDAAERCAGKGKFYTPNKAGSDEHQCTDIVVTHE